MTRLCRGGDVRLQLMFHNQDWTMRRLIGLASISLLAFLVSGCARPFEIGWTPAYTANERGNQILRNWDYEGKQKDDDIDSLLLLRPASRLTIWHVR